MNSESWDEFYSVYGEIQVRYKEFIRAISTPQIKLLNLKFEIPTIKDYAEIFSIFATDLLVANCFISEGNRFSIQNLVDCNNKFVEEFDNYTSGLQILLKNFDFSLEMDTNNPNTIPFDIFHMLGERVVQKEVPDSGIIFTPSGVVNLISIQSLLLHLRNFSQLNNRTILQILIGGDPSVMKSISQEEMKTLYSVISQIRILDPACGTGLFCIAMAKILYQIQSFFDSSYKKRTRAEILRDNIFGIDVNPKIIFKLFFLIQLWLIHHHEEPLTLDVIQSNFICDDSLLREYKPNEKYDIILGNPPYVRQENIRPLGVLNLKDLGVLEKNYKETIMQKLSGLGYHINKRSDLYIFFFYLAITLLKEGGIISYLTSNSWLNIGFGFEFQEFILNNADIYSVIDFDVRAFSDAEINTIITTLSSFSHLPQNLKRTHFTRIKTSIDNETVRNVLYELYTHEKTMHNHQIQEMSDCISPLFYSRSVMQKDLISGIRWGNEYFLAPSIYFDLKKHYGIKLLNLGEIATITRGITTGLNKFFILEKISERNDFVTVRNGYNYEFQIERGCLKPFLVSPKPHVKPLLMQDEFKHYILAIPEDMAENIPKYAKQYIKYARSIEIEQTKGINKGKTLIGAQCVPTLKGKSQFFSLKVPLSSRGTQIFIQKIFSSKYKVYISPADRTILANNTFYNINLKPELKEFFILIVASLLSSFTYLSIELNGRRCFGMGALDTASFDIENLFVVNPRQIPDSMKKELELCVNSIANREFLEVTEEFRKNDRKKLDFLLLKCLNMDNKQEELYDSINYLVQQRISKSKTYKQKI